MIKCTRKKNVRNFHVIKPVKMQKEEISFPPLPLKGDIRKEKRKEGIVCVCVCFHEDVDEID